MVKQREKYDRSGGQLAELLTRIRLETRQGQAFEILKEFAEDTGFRQAACMEIYDDGTAAPDSHIANTAFNQRKLMFNWDPYNWTSHYIKNDYSQHDPSRWLFRDRSRTYITQEQMAKEGSPEVANIVRAATAPPFNFKEGIFIPLATDLYRLFAITLHGSWGAISDLSAEGLSALLSIAHATMIRESTLSAESPKLDGMPSLTKSQQETIDLLMEGCSEQETANIRGVSTNAVFMARRLLKKKFGVDSITALKATYALKLTMLKHIGSKAVNGLNKAP